jgi:hypothetical protein
MLADPALPCRFDDELSETWNAAATLYALVMRSRDHGDRTDCIKWVTLVSYSLPLLSFMVSLPFQEPSVWGDSDCVYGARTIAFNGCSKDEGNCAALDAHS